ncbi:MULTISPECIES: hypothetical protein [unclassified Streptomyces]|uniref:hypothetical protein n=1 Tax=unclassified Streptomyces TaxID=2593676 RepID=UPI000DACAA59|nr:MULTISPECIES: hypothetical protein [unclassified Streptomyces]PZT74676.1 hypothetical protein DNK55_21605 [Streptomyces sp. AC1-42T]PZT82338.1 hypothetical protein DNK56_09840 [Streptomyces sp. AC1-42W]
MSTERPDNDVTTTRRRSPLVAASVAAAVLLAGGGGAYWAATAADGGDGGPRTTSAASDPAAPPPLRLDGVYMPLGEPSGPPRGIAPGEPDPSGGRVVYRATGKLPDGPDEAAVRRAGGTVTAADVARLAKALGLPGTPQSEATYWKVGSDGDGSGPLLRVNKQAPGTWTFTRFGSGGTDNCKKGPVCSGGGVAPGGSGQPVDERTAKAAAAPVLQAAGQSGAALDAGQLMGSARVVNADPVVDGLPTYGWTTGVQVGPDGTVVGGSGRLKAPEKGDTYPVIGAQEALDRLNAAQAPAGGIGGCASPAPLENGTDSSGARCGVTSGEPRPATTVPVEKAVFGLAAHTTGGEQVLVPSWIFSVKPAGGAGDTVTQVAVDPEYLAREPSPGTSPDGDATAKARAVRSYSADGRSLAVTFWGGACATYTVDADENGGEVRVTVREKKDPGKVCVLVAKEQTRTVTLERPLDGRKVIDAESGSVVPRA